MIKEVEVKEPKRAIVQRSPPPVAYEICSAPSTPPNSNPQAIFSPSVPQVEYIMLDKMTCETEGAKNLHAPKGREQEQEPIMRRETRSITSSKNLKILTPIKLSESDEEYFCSKTLRIITRPYGSVLSPHAHLRKNRGHRC